MPNTKVTGEMFITSIPTRAMVMLVRIYQLALSPYLGGRCRHDPSCSVYAVEAFERYGLLKGGRLAVWRLMRCHPWGTWGYDPVPQGFHRKRGRGSESRR